ncbi:hypothetical protein CN884_12660 [Ochrobactrum sp. 30A/1000/2015]|nr:hypothetical protein CN884_12660 [Ochrobactrum sp. 30A/1000/2015]PJT37673.1 hypothetical protein CN883_17075 [Ochrobactrum sp. 27A/999/2015]PJT42521.1 hypothetical protein CN882_15075 [Ochrobactrum sp. 23A/997/2015]
MHGCAPITWSGSCSNRIAGTALSVCFSALSIPKPFHTFAGNALKQNYWIIFYGFRIKFTKALTGFYKKQRLCTRLQKRRRGGAA